MQKTANLRFQVCSECYFRVDNFHEFYFSVEMSVNMNRNLLYGNKLSMIKDYCDIRGKQITDYITKEVC